MNSVKNRVQLIGHLGADPEMKTLETGTQMARLRLATTEGYKNAQGEWHNETMWHTIIAWGKLAERAARSFHKGSHLLIEGALVNRSYNDSAGEKKFISEVRAGNIIMLDKKAAEQAAAEPEMQSNEVDDGLPF